MWTQAWTEACYYLAKAFLFILDSVPIEDKLKCMV